MDDIDRELMVAFRDEGLDTFDATFHDGVSAPVDTIVMRNTIELNDEFGVPTVRSGVELKYLKAEVTPKLGHWFQFDSHKHFVEDTDASQDSSVGTVFCRKEAL